MTGDPLPRSPRLLERLLSMRIEEPGSSRSFEQALADEYAWSPRRAEAISAEYRRFLFLAATAGREVTPSILIDKAWHLHLTYTRHYWDGLCGELLGRPLHHRPSSGGTLESEHFVRQYEATLALYEATFGQPPPPSIWPRRNAPKIVGRSGSGVMPLPRAIVIGAVIACISGTIAGVPGFVVAAILCFAMYLILRESARSRRGATAAGGGCGGDGGWIGDCGDGGGGGGCGGGCGS